MENEEQQTPSIKDVSVENIASMSKPAVIQEAAPAPVLEDVNEIDIPEDPKPVVSTVEAIVPTVETVTPVSEVIKEPVENKKYKVTQQYSEKPEKWQDDDVTVSLPSLPVEETTKVIEKTPNIDFADSDESKEWIGVINEGIDNAPMNNAFNITLNDKDADFTQEVAYNGIKCDINELKTNFNSQNLKGERALFAFDKHIGIGTLVHVPLWHTGIWITVKSPGEGEILQLAREIASDKIDLGRATSGLAFSNVLVYTVERVTRFVLDHIYNTSLKPEALENRDIRDIIKAQDLNILVWGVLCSMYPRGFQYKRSCLSDPEKCNYVLKEKVNLRKLLWVNYKALDESHKNFMAQKQPQTKSYESVMEYQNSLAKLSEKVITIGKDEKEVKISLHSPSLLNHINSGTKWINNIVNIIDQAATDASKKEKNDFITQEAQASALLQIGYWIKSIDFGEYVVDDIETLEKLLARTSQDDDMREKIMEEVIKYTQMSTISLIAIPSYSCPNCKEPQTNVDNINPNFANLIPLDVIQLFFDQHMQRMQKIAIR